MPMSGLMHFGNEKPVVAGARRVTLVLYYLLLIITSISFVELVIMPSLKFVSFHPHLLWYLVNILLLTLIMLPVLYWFAIRQLNAQLVKLTNSDTTFKVLSEMLRDGILVINTEGVVCYANPASCELFQRPSEQLVGLPFGYPVVDDGDAEITILRPDGQKCIVAMRVNSIILNGITVLLASLHEVTEQKRLQLELEELATHDGLTGLYNHQSFYAMLNAEFQRTQRYKHPLSLVMLDIDHFKQVNDNYGHRAGDAILRDLSTLLKERMRNIDHVCRYGGEEFMMLLPETGVEGAMAVAESIRKMVEMRDFDVGEGKRISITVSIGIASYPDHQNDAIGLVTVADAALYTAKERGRNGVSLAMA